MSNETNLLDKTDYRNATQKPNVPNFSSEVELTQFVSSLHKGNYIVLGPSHSVEPIGTGLIDQKAIVNWTLTNDKEQKNGVLLRISPSDLLKIVIPQRVNPALMRESETEAAEIKKSLAYMIHPLDKKAAVMAGSLAEFYTLRADLDRQMTEIPDLTRIPQEERRQYFMHIDRIEQLPHGYNGSEETAKMYRFLLEIYAQEISINVEQLTSQQKHAALFDLARDMQATTILDSVLQQLNTNSPVSSMSFLKFLITDFQNKFPEYGNFLPETTLSKEHNELIERLNEAVWYIHIQQQRCLPFFEFADHLTDHLAAFRTRMRPKGYDTIELFMTSVAKTRATDWINDAKLAVNAAGIDHLIQDNN